MLFCHLLALGKLFFIMYLPTCDHSARWAVIAHFTHQLLAPLLNVQWLDLWAVRLH